MTDATFTRASQVNGQPVANREARLTEALVEYRALLDAGNAPERAAFLAKHPDVAASLAECLAGLEFVHAAAPQLSRDVEDTPIPKEAMAFTEPLGDFRIIREIGRGGMGVVYEAEQMSLGRRVALKVLPFAATMDSRQLQRFKNEAQAAAHLQHTNIVPVHYVGSERGVHFYAMQYIEGQSLAQVIEHLRESANVKPSSNVKTTAYAPGALPAQETRAAHRDSTQTRSKSKRSRLPAEHYQLVAQLGIQAAEALDHAHQMGIVHRDVKPANLMLSPLAPLGRGVGGEGSNYPRLWVTDFGLAQVANDTKLTMTGDLLGTLRYMSPEQALAQRVIVDHRTDVYSLGATLYELLTLEPVFDGVGRQEVLRQIAFEEPRSPRRIDGRIPPELETIVLKALEKDPLHRYATAKELADDLRRYSLHEPIRAKRPGVIQKARKWARRHREVVAAIAVVSALLLGLAGWLAIHRANQRAVADEVVRQTLSEAEDLQRQRKHADALAVAIRAKGLATSGGASRSVQGLAERRCSELELVLRLDEVRLERTAVKDEKWDIALAERRYGEEFREAGIDVDELAVEEAVRRIHNTSIALELAAALDSWARDRRVARGDLDWKRPLKVARLVDPNPWRCRLRDAWETNDRKALEDLGRGKEVTEQPPSTLDILGTALMDNGAGKQAVELLREVQRLHPTDFWVNHSLAAFIRSVEPEAKEDVLRYMSVAVTLRPQSPGVRINFGNAFKAKGRLDDAIAEFREALRLKPDYRGARMNLGQALIDRGRADEAIAEFRELIRLQQEDPWGHDGLGRALERADRWDEAIAAFGEAIRLDPKFGGAYTGWAIALCRQGRHVEALAVERRGLAVVEELIAKSPKDSGLRHKLAGMQNNVALELLDAPAGRAEAEALLRSAIATQKELVSEEPSNDQYGEYLSNMHASLARLLLKLDKHEEAETEARHALLHRNKLLSESPTDVQYRTRLASAQAVLAEVLINRNKHQEAFSQHADCVLHLKRLIAEDPRARRYRAELANAHFRFGNRLYEHEQDAEAAAEFRQTQALAAQLVADFPELPENEVLLGGASCNLGNALKEQNLNEEALQWYEQAVRVLMGVWQRAPKTPGVRSYLRRSYRNRAKSLVKLNRVVEGIMDYDRALDLYDTSGPATDDSEELNKTIEIERTLSWLSLNPKEEVARAEALVRDEKALPSAFFHAACIYALCSTNLGDAATREQYATRALSLLYQAGYKGYFKDPGCIAELRTHPGLEAVRARPEFQRFLAFTEAVQRLPESRDSLFALLGLSVFVPANPSIQKTPACLQFGPDRNGDQVSDLYVSGRQNHNVVVYDGRTGAFIEEFVGPASGLNGANWFAIGPDGDLFIGTHNVDTDKRDTILRVKATSKSVSRFVSNDNPGGNGGLIGSKGMAFDDRGLVYVASVRTDQILRYETATGKFIDVFVAANSGGLGKPASVHFGPDRNDDGVKDLYVSSNESGQILVYCGADGASLGVFVDKGAGDLQRPHNTCFGPDGHLYVVDQLPMPLGQRVLRFDGNTGAFLDVLIPGGVIGATAFIAFDGQGDLYVCNENAHEVLRYRRPRESVK